MTLSVWSQFHVPELSVPRGARSPPLIFHLYPDNELTDPVDLQLHHNDVIEESQAYSVLSRAL